MVCKFCGNENAISAINCSVCGRPLIILPTDSYAVEEDKEFGGPDPEYFALLRKQEERQKLLEAIKRQNRREAVSRIKRVFCLVLLAALLAAVCWFCLISPSSPMRELLRGVSRSDVAQAIYFINKFLT